MDIRQSDLYANYVRGLGWIVEEVEETKIFIRKFLFFGSVIKIQRQNRVLQIKMLNALAKKYHAKSISIEPMHDLHMDDFRINKHPYLPTKTIQIDLTVKKEQIFKRFTEAKRRAVRRAIKNGIFVKESKKVDEFIKLKAKSFWPLGWFLEKDLKLFWESLQPNNITALSAYYEDKLIASVLLPIFDGVVYYWMAASSSEGKKLFAPTLLVWEALKLGKEKRCTIFDFEGVYDERFHNATKQWKGFTKFKMGFGGRELLFPHPLIKNYRAF
jgi:lipid II:glycine glycyltransferase (peptidoglycan interpeptide bridge formation enzyme)